MGRAHGALPSGKAIGSDCGLLDEGLELADADGDGGGQIGVGGALVVVHGNAAHLGHGLARDIGAEGGSLLIPLFADGGRLFHAVGIAQLILRGLRGGQVGGDLAGGVELHVCLDGVDQIILYCM